MLLLLLYGLGPDWPLISVESPLTILKRGSIRHQVIDSRESEITN